MTIKSVAENHSLIQMMPDQSLMETDLHERKTYVLLKEADFLRMGLGELTTLLKTLEPTCKTPDSSCEHCVCTHRTIGQVFPFLGHIRGKPPVL